VIPCAFTHFNVRRQGISTMRLASLSVGALALCALAFVVPAHAGSILLNAVSYADIPAGHTVSVETFDDSEDNMALKDRFIAALQAKGYTVADKAPLIFSFEITDSTGAWTGGGPNRLIELRNNENHTGTNAPDVRVNIFDSKRGGLLNPKRDKGITEVAPSEYRIDAAVEERASGRRLWEGWTAAAVGAADDPALHQAMVSPLIDNIGKSVREKSYPTP